MADMQGIIEKVQKLRRLARSDNVHEAAAAAAAADRLIQDHGLAEAQLESQGAAPVETPAEDADAFASWHGPTPTWQRILASSLIRHYDCASYLAWDYSRCDRHNRPALVQKVIGRASDIAAARYMWGWLSVEIERLAQENRGNGRSWLDSFRRGAVTGVMNALYESKRRARASVEASGKVAAAINPDLGRVTTGALAIYDRRREDALEAMKTAHPDVAERLKRSRGGSHFRGASSHDGYESGKRAGANIHVGAALASGGTRALKG